MTETTELTDDMTNSAQLAVDICNGLPEYARLQDADPGLTAMLLCGFLASKIIGEGEGYMTKQEFFHQIEMALLAIGDGTDHPTSQ